MQGGENNNGFRLMALGVVLTLGAVVAREYLPPRTVDLLAPGGNTYFISNDARTLQADRVQWIDAQRFHFQCHYLPQDKDDYQPCSLTFLLTAPENLARGTDLRRFDSLSLDLAYRGSADFVRVSVRNFDPRFSRLEDANSSRIHTVNLRRRDLSGPLTIDLSELTVPEWWIGQYNLPREYNTAGLDNATSITIDLPGRINGAVQELMLRGLRLQGEWIGREALYRAILALWVLGAVGALLRRLLQLRERQHRQEQEIAALVARTARLHAEQDDLRRLALLDELTGLLNRRGVEHAMAERPLAPAHNAVIVVDIDHFKRVNDTHGHDAGDQVLRRVAAVMAQNVRADDVLGRWGGEEFLVVCSGCAPEDAQAVAEKIRRRIEGSAFGSRHRIPVTASLGVAMTRAGEPFADTFRRADAALYRAKSSGRNRVVMDEPESEPVLAASA